MSDLRWRLLPYLLLAALPAQAAGEFYCCQDPASGRRLCGDTLPAQCRGRAYQQYDSGGNVTKEVGAPLTPEQKAAQEQENRRLKQVEEANREQRRKDQALLDTYSSLTDIDVTQRNAEADVNETIRQTQASIELASKKLKKLNDEAEFYKKKPMPADLEKNLRAVNHELQLQKELLDVKRHEFDQIKTKYDADRKRYLELTGSRRSVSTAAPAPAAAPRR